MDRIFCKIAETTFEFYCEGDLRFAEIDQMRGFALAEKPENTDLRIRVSFAAEEEFGKPVEAEKFFKSSRTEMGFSDHQWILRTFADGSESIEVQHFNNPRFLWTRLTVNGRNGELQICPTQKPGNRICAYAFPSINLTLSRIVMRRRGFMIHSSVVDDGGRGYLFTAVSGTGKSTMARLWESTGASIVNDDMIVVLPTADGRFEASNIPMQLYVSEPKKVQLSAFFLISQSKQNFIRPVKGARAVLRLMANTIQQVYSSEMAALYLEIISAACERIPVFELGFKPDTDIVDEIRKLNL